jgi:hypothetical protein
MKVACCVLDFGTMSYWRKLFLVVLLALSLPAQSFAAASMNCEPSHFGGDGASAQHAALDESTHLHMHGAMMADGLHHSHHQGDAHPAHTCPACAACCFGMALPVVPTVAAAPGAVHLSVPLPPVVRVASFLTDGVERPPRTSLV